jgi:hypothetical protein
MNLKIVKIVACVLVLTLVYLPLSVFFPKYFVQGGVNSNFNIDLKNFSLMNPEYIMYDLNNSNNQYEVMFIELNRDWNLLWKYDKSKSKYALLPKSNLEEFKSEAKKYPNIKSDELLQKSKVLIEDKLKILETDTKEIIQYKQAFNPPNRENSTQYNLDKFKLLKKGDKFKVYESLLGKGDFGLSPDKFYQEGYRLEYVIGSPKIQFAFITFKEGYPDVDEESKTTFGLLDIGFVTQRQERVIVPVNPDGTYNWEAVKDKID